MKKILAVLLVGLAATSFGVVNIDWSSSYGYYFDLGAGNPGLGILGDAGDGKSTVAQLVYCGANGLRDKVNIGGGALLNDEVTAGDDVVWASWTLSEDGIAGDDTSFSSYAHFAGNLQNYQQAFTSGNVYARIFQDNVIDGKDWYFYTETLALSDITGTMFAQSIEMAGVDFIAINGALMNPTIGSGAVGTSQVIPEPATFLLMGIGGFGAWILRRRQQA